MGYLIDNFSTVDDIHAFLGLVDALTAQIKG